MAKSICYRLLTVKNHIYVREKLWKLLGFKDIDKFLFKKVTFSLTSNWETNWINFFPSKKNDKTEKRILQNVAPEKAIYFNGIKLTN